MSDKVLWAVKNGDVEAIKEHLKDSSVDAVLRNGRNILHYASDYGQVEIVRYMCERKADINLPDKHGITPLLAAIFENHIECVEILIKAGAKKDGKAPDGSSYYDSAESAEIKELLK